MSFLKCFIFLAFLFPILPSYASPDDYPEDHPSRAVKMPIPGNIVRVSDKLKPGAYVERGAVLFVCEAMKMEMTVSARMSGYITGALPQVGDTIVHSNPLFRIAKINPAETSLPIITAPPINPVDSTSPAPLSLPEKAPDPVISAPLPPVSQTPVAPHPIAVEEAKKPVVLVISQDIPEEMQEKTAANVDEPHDVNSSPKISRPYVAPDREEKEPFVEGTHGEAMEKVSEENARAFIFSGGDNTPPPPNASSLFERGGKENMLDSLQSYFASLRGPEGAAAIQHVYLDRHAHIRSLAMTSITCAEGSSTTVIPELISSETEHHKPMTHRILEPDQEKTHPQRVVPSFEQWENFVKSLLLFSVLYLLTIKFGEGMMFSGRLRWLRVRM